MPTIGKKIPPQEGKNEIEKGISAVHWRWAVLGAVLRFPALDHSPGW